MKTKLLYFIICIFTTIATNAQSIAVVGVATVIKGVGDGSDGWPDSDPSTPDTHIMTTQDNITFTLTGLELKSGGLKFRQDGDWTINWGGALFPTGTGIRDGANIPVIAGTYDLTFNILTGEYSFSGGPEIFIVKILGTAVTPPEGVSMATEDGETYKLTGTFTDGTAQFEINGGITGGSTFPSGTTTLNTNFIPVTAGIWAVSFNITTGQYHFIYPTISITGTGVGGWGVDIDLETIDGINYTKNGIEITPSGIPASTELKFRQDHAWTVGWAEAAWPTGTGTSIGANIPAETGTYDITFNIITGEYAFSKLLSTKEFGFSNFKAYPNPTQNNWNFTSANERIESIKIVDVLGKNVMTVSPKTNTANVDASNLTSGMYFAQIATAKAIETIKLIKN
ncbi:T9SS type A sorting domain-containing protein [Flavobacterium psychrotolerans]|uniref:Secretion system C-terminal sorting domain-containing protein n=1 Tax=Flavobacterium psychrotolerans TaxID=2169410 RepID=A0A2U1JQG4_9FLAO|nr:T9SS type A sorting domain-containing protein [Flavobacterium psychrotolerans]PWA07417.1 hypothetical protein DB895_01485 [Flavobacterium psychrotolerans]